ncbi:winged helix-turn-helix transcriptional regulator [Streptomyces sp. NPDC056704]|uniref:winged helix-turn-helix transcriptional regulator n=1 Tax=Streptomyces sp. NPDC056704 TaxID=3345917 RepID=UPI0036AAF29A
MARRGDPDPGGPFAGTGASAPGNPPQGSGTPAPLSPASSAPVPGRPVRGSAGGRPVMAALDLLGRRWTLRVIWELHRNGAPIGFRDLQRRCDDMSSSVLSTRLTELREAGIAASTSTAAQPTWRLTALGDDLVTAMGPLLDWSRAWAERR